MGEEIEYSRFLKSDYDRFEKQLRTETELLAQHFDNATLSNNSLVAGYELEAWLIDSDAGPCPHNEAFLQRADNELLSPELARFNIELNVAPQGLSTNVLQAFETDLLRMWKLCENNARALDCHILGIGILPTLRDEDLTLENLSTLERYRALNEQVLRQRRGESVQLKIVGEQNLETEHMDVMLEAASTSLQIHIQTPQSLAVRYYNASIVLSAPMVAIAANAPFLFGRHLWEDTRIPVFEQSVPAGGFEGASHGPIQRVGFGTAYARDSLIECFIENEQHFPILLPVDFETEAEEFRHLRLHNGTIWRWNRPLIGFDDDGTPHIRIEHRVCSSGASAQDNIANIAFYYGLVHYYAELTEPPEQSLAFSRARDNFYLAAKHGLNSQIEWVGQERNSIKKLILDRLLAEAETGLHKLKIDDRDIKKYLGIIEARVAGGQNGSQWQLQFAQKHDHDMKKLTLTYFNNQRLNVPVHDWDFVNTL